MARRTTPSYTSHHLDIYDARLYLATTKAQWRALARKVTMLDPKAPESAGMAQFAVYHPNGPALHVPVLVLWIDLANHTHPAEIVNTIAHEAAHAAGQLLEHIGHQRAGVDEPHAYLVGWLSSWIWDNGAGARATELVTGQP